MKKQLLLFFTLIYAVTSWGQSSISSDNGIKNALRAAKMGRTSSVQISSSKPGGMQNFLEKDFSIDCWVYPTWDKNKEAWYFIFGYGMWDDDFNSFKIAFESKSSSGWVLRVSDGNDDDSNADLKYSFKDDYYESHFKNQWTHIAVTMDFPYGSEKDGTIKLYINGYQKATKGGFDLISKDNCQSVCHIGDGYYRSVGSFNEECFDGYISGFRLWNKFLSSNEINNIKDAAFAESGTFPANIKGLEDYLVVNTYMRGSSIKSETPNKNFGIQLTSKNVSASSYMLHHSKPAKPSILKIVEECDYTKLTWDNSVLGGTNYVYRKKDTESNYQLLVRTNDDYYTDNDIEKGVKYDYQLYSQWKRNSSYYRSEKEYITGGSKALPYPTHLDLDDSEICQGILNFSWDENQGATNGYDILRKIENGAWDVAHTLDDPSTTSYQYSFPNEDIGKNITYAISATGDGCTYFEEGGEKTILMEGPCTQIPTNVVASENNGNINITWDFTQPQYSQASGFKIYRNDDPNPIGTLKNLPNTRSFEDKTAESCVEYRYRVQAVNDCNEGDIDGISDWSSTFTKSLAFKDVFTKGSFDASKGYFNDRILLQWEVDPAQKADISAFEIYRKKASDDSFTLLATLTNGNTTEHTDKSLDANVLYQYKIQAKAECNGEYALSEVLFSNGFRTNVGIVSGKVTYKGGNAVEGVELRVQSDYFAPSYCAQLDGSTETQLSLDKELENGEEISKKGVNFEAWINPEYPTFTLLSAGQFRLEYENRIPKITVSDGQGGSAILDCQKAPISLNKWNHVSLNISPELVEYYVNGTLVDRKEFHLQAWTDNPYFLVGENFSGKLDELRIWEKCQTKEEIKRDYQRILVGEESNLLAYMRLDEGFGNYAYDISHERSLYHKNHFKATKINWSNEVPDEELLHVSAITDKYGNYKVSSIRYDGNGGTFKLVPMYGSHEFDPHDMDLYIGDNAQVHNKVDITDISSFQVKGKIVYKNTNFPVNDVYIKVDGNFVQGDDNKPVKTDEKGEYIVNVPIGEHYIELDKNGHHFKSSHFPALSEDGEVKKHFFNAPIDILNFYDVTRVKLVGKVVGGPIEAAKITGSVDNPSKNNIGQVKIHLTTEKGNNLPNGRSDTTIVTETTDGNYVVELLPEVYKPVNALAIGNGKYTFNRDVDLSPINLTNAFTDKYSIDSVYQTQPDNSKLLTKVDTVLTYQMERNWIWRSTPELSVTNIKRTSLLGDSIYMYKAPKNVDSLKIATETGGTVEYKFGHPLFQMGNKYTFMIKAFESYENHDDTEAKVDIVPVTDGQVLITNSCGVNGQALSYPLNENGILRYQFSAGFPNIAAPFTKSIDIQLKVGTQNYPWSESPMSAYVFGSMPTGNNFVTKGPDNIDFILRDPPGSNSYAYFEKGFTTTKSVVSSTQNGYESETDLVYMMGINIETQTGSPVFSVTNEFRSDDNIGIHEEHEFNWGNETETTETTTYNQGFNTSESPDYVGAMGDIFFGKSTNIVYGAAVSLEILKPKEKLNELPSTGTNVGISGSDYTIGQRKVLRFCPEINTTFVYTQNHIENALIPNLESLRNAFYKAHQDRYQLNVTDPEDPHYLSNNNDQFIWGSQAVIDNPHKGPSYKYIAREKTEDGKIVKDEKTGEVVMDLDADSVYFYNKEIIQWKNHLAENERQKILAKKYAKDKFPENISFDAGSNFEASIETSSDTTRTESYEWSINAGLALEVGIRINKAGFKLTTTQTYHHAGNSSSTNTSEENKTVGFILADEDAGDYYTIDIKECQNGNGPVFKTRGGQSGCPYEGAEISKYYHPGTIFSEATMQIEKPQINCAVTQIAGIPETESAYFTLELSNISETSDDVWYNLMVDMSSNPDGAKIYLDGNAMSSEGKAILIPANATVTKTLEVKKGRPDVNDYNSLRVILHSMCQYDPTDFVADIADTVLLTAQFEPACSPIELVAPLDKWLVNADMHDTLPVKINGYNLQHERLKSIGYQYKAQSSSTWTPLYWWVKDSENTNKDAIRDTLELNGNSDVTFQWSLTDLRDRRYDVRAVSYCSDGTKSYSEVKSGTLDGQRPRTFGQPQPSDGVLSTGEDISIRFSEPLETGLITSSNFSIKGVLNGYEIDHQCSLFFDGNNSNTEVNKGINLSFKSFTMEFWAKAGTSNGTFFHYGTAENSAAMKLVNGTQLEVSIANYKASGTIPTDINTANWHHYVYVYDKEKHQIQAYVDDQKIVTKLLTDQFAFTASGKLIMGADSQFKNFFNGNIHDVRLWNEAKSLADCYADMHHAPSPTTSALIGLWPFDEASGNLATDKAENRHATLVNAVWDVDPKGKSLNITNNSFAVLNAQRIPVDQDKDYTIEFWFKAGTQSEKATLWSCGTEGYTKPELYLNIAALVDGNIAINANGSTLETTNSNFCDNNWHHMALTVSRVGNAKLYLDGELKTETNNKSINGFAASEILLGARKVKNTVEEVVSHFNGYMDEIRIWESELTHDELKLQMNHHLRGDEAGLIAYYPFETYQKDQFDRIIQQNTLNDLSGTTDSPAILMSAANYSTDAPNIKDARPTEEIPFSFTANENEIILTPDVDPSRIEKCILEISTKDVEDLHGNRMASPAKWTAFVDRNALVWEVGKLSKKVFINQPTKFEVKILNRGGSKEDFTIENLPAWLDASTFSGMVEPLSETTIHFTVSPSLNYGDYQETILLTSASGYNEKLTISISVRGEEPDWTLNQGKYEYSMSLIGKLAISGDLTTDTQDKVAAFINGECRGISNVTFYKDYNLYLVPLQIFSNNTSDEVTFKVWDASTGKIHGNVTPILAFEKNGIKGRPTSPILIEANKEVEAEIPVNTGWNWISFNLETENLKTTKGILGGIKSADGDQIKGSNHFDSYAENFGWDGSLTVEGGFEIGKMYMLKTSFADTIHYFGSPAPTISHSITLSPGWNWIGFVPQTKIPVADAFAYFDNQLDNLVKSRTQFSMYDPIMGWIGSLKYLEPGQGYMYYSNASDPVVFNYPQQSLYTKSSTLVNSPSSFVPNEFSHNMSIIAEVVGLEGLNGQIQVTTNGKNRGTTSSETINGEKLFFISVGGNAQFTGDLSFKLHAGDRCIELKPENLVQFKSDAIIGLPSAPLQLFASNEGMDFGAEKALEVHPNPFLDRVSFKLKGEVSDVRIMISDVAGKMVKEFQVSNQSLIEWDGCNSLGVTVNSGIYVVNVIADDVSYKVKVVKL